MNHENFGFCENEAISCKAYNLVADNLLGREQLGKIVRRYGDMRANFNKCPKDFAKHSTDEWVFGEGLEPFAPKGRGCYSDTTAVPIPISHPDFIELTNRTENRGAIGLDLPTWFTPHPDAPFIMIVAQDPLRNAAWYGDMGNEKCHTKKGDETFLCEDAIVSSPFGLQDAHHREKGNGGKRMWLLVQALLERGFNIYLTDCRKFFVYDHRESDKYTSSRKMDLYRNILKEEIDIINPKLIVTLGHRAEKCCSELLGDDDRLSGYIPHICGTACRKIKYKFYLKGKTDINELSRLYADIIVEKLHRKSNSSTQSDE